MEGDMKGKERSKEVKKEERKKGGRKKKGRKEERKKGKEGDMISTHLHCSLLWCRTKWTEEGFHLR